MNPHTEKRLATFYLPGLVSRQVSVLWKFTARNRFGLSGGPPCPLFIRYHSLSNLQGRQASFHFSLYTKIMANRAEAPGSSGER